MDEKKMTYLPWTIVKVNMYGWKNGRRDFVFTEASRKRYQTKASAKAAAKKMKLPFDSNMADAGEYWTLAKADDDYPGGFMVHINHEERIFVDNADLSFIQMDNE